MLWYDTPFSNNNVQSSMVPGRLPLAMDRRGNVQSTGGTADSGEDVD